MRKPRTLTWLSSRPRNSIAPSGEQPRPVAGAVEAGAGHAGMGIGHEFFGREAGPPVVAVGEAGAAQAKLAGQAERQRLERGVQHVGPHARPAACRSPPATGRRRAADPRRWR